MQRHSESIGSIAAALAKAQTELANPEKLLTATIQSSIQPGAERSFRYASLASGLDLVRKSLGRHEIATVQITSIDQGVGIIRLTTTLAHSSGEWIASDWPVCSVAETAAPHKMGAALTYARRYALFTLVGIAGEDDLDAPDLNNVVRVPPHSAHSNVETGNSPPEKDGLSKVLRERLISELRQFALSDSLTTWAHRVLPLKDQLTVTDANEIETAFAAKLCELGEVVSGVNDTPARRKHSDHVRETTSSNTELLNQNISAEDRADEAAIPSETTLSRPLRRRNRDHLKFVGTQPCLACGRHPSDAHHIKFAQQRALGRKVSDEYTVPLCRAHHREVHRRGNERDWWQHLNIDPLQAAQRLWQQTQSDAQMRAARSQSTVCE